MVIYMTTNQITGEKYIGKDRNNSPSYIGGGVLLKEAVKKYGKNNFKKEILETCNSIEELKEKECYWLEYYDVANNSMFYNLTNKSFGSDNGPTKTEKYLKRGEKISRARKRKHYPNASQSQKGLKKPKVSKALKGKPKTEEHRQNLSKSKKGVPSKRKGKSDYKQRDKPKPGAGNKKCNNLKGRTSGKPILDKETGKIYNFVKDVIQEFGYHKRKFYIILSDPDGRFQYFNT